LILKVDMSRSLLLGRGGGRGRGGVAWRGVAGVKWMAEAVGGRGGEGGLVSWTVGRGVIIGVGRHGIQPAGGNINVKVSVRGVQELFLLLILRRR